MKWLLCCLILLVALQIPGCSRDGVLAPRGVDTTDVIGKPAPPPQFYSLGWDMDWWGYTEYMKIDAHSGAGTIFWTLPWDMNSPYFQTPLGMAYDLNGDMYMLVNYFALPGGFSRLLLVDKITGAVTYIGDPIPAGFWAPDIDSRGNLYSTAVWQDEQGNYLPGSGLLYRIDKETGTATRVGDNPPEPMHPDYMDLAFDSQDRLWTTTRNKLFRFDTQTGIATYIMDVTGIPGAPADPNDPGQPLAGQQIMGIAFDGHDVLYATSMDAVSGDPGPLMTIDLQTGRVTVIGYTGLQMNHGGDIYPTEVLIMHLNDDGQYVEMEIGMAALPAHLAHGDYVPGTRGHPW